MKRLVGCYSAYFSAPDIQLDQLIEELLSSESESFNDIRSIQGTGQTPLTPSLCYDMFSGDEPENISWHDNMTVHLIAFLMLPMLDCLLAQGAPVLQVMRVVRQAFNHGGRGETL
ncbi:hypothetical protein M378DRAFT_181956 [Amanita muscaria Koide BX008]|uniref:Uncharacterized protein n=1 Tax=Amanita muscaria (strain Koide BX008) TaxID=946122 RepID=A0A0C2W5X8_AMAMK|nr:hypothetical protein M378DRAFT_181956 [Amanita muscaria Koide BX008]